MVARTITVTYTGIDTAPAVSSNFAGYAYESDATKLTFSVPITFLEVDADFLADGPSANALFVAFRTPDGVELLSETSYSQGIYDVETSPVTFDFTLPQAAMRHGKIDLCLVSVDRGIDAEAEEYTGNAENDYDENFDYTIQYKTKPFVLQVANAPAPDVALEVYGGTIVSQIFERIEDAESRLDDLEDMEHNDWGGKQGGTTDEYYHLTQAQHDDLTDGGTTTLHNHDGRYDLSGTGAAEVASHVADEDPHPQYWMGADAPDHNELDGLQGGTDDEYNHITDDEATAVATIEGVTTDDNGKLFAVAAGVIAVDADIKVGGTNIVFAKNVQTHVDEDNTVLGVGAYASDVSGDQNVAIGYQAARLNQSGDDNVVIGAYALDANTSGNQNTAIGTSALGANVSGSYSVAVGHGALLSNTASGNTAVGHNALVGNIGATENTGIGAQAGYSLQTGSQNTLVGYHAGYSATGEGNTALGARAMEDTVAGEENVAIGLQALANNVSGSWNVAVGDNALQANTADENTAVGETALTNNTSGTLNTGIGAYAGYYNTDGDYNTSLGGYALERNNGGSNNVAVGYEAGKWQADGETALASPENSIYIGAESKGKDNDDSNSIVIGYGAVGIGANTTVIGNADTTIFEAYGVPRFSDLASVGLLQADEDGDLVAADAGDVGITDAGEYFTGTDVEAALQELGSDMATHTHDAVDNQRATANPVQFWTGTQAQYDAIGAGNYDADTVYFITAS